MITGHILGKEQLIERLNSMPTLIHQWVRQAVLEQTVLLQRHVVEDKLTGQVLKTQTGTLKRSVNPDKPNVEETDSKIVGIVGTNLKYGAIHEYGGVVAEHQRLVTMVFGKPLKFPVWATVRSFVLPERSFLRSALADRATDIRDAIQKAAAKGIQGAKA